MKAGLPNVFTACAVKKGENFHAPFNSKLTTANWMTGDRFSGDRPYYYAESLHSLITVPYRSTD
jgi:hypothetical protein